MQYQLVTTKNGQRLWLPILAGAAIISAPLWLNNNNKNQQCCPYPVNQNINPYYMYPVYQYPYYPNLPYTQINYNP